MPQSFFPLFIYLFIDVFIYVFTLTEGQAPPASHGIVLTSRNGGFDGGGVARSEGFLRHASTQATLISCDFLPLMVALHSLHSDARASNEKSQKLENYDNG